MSHFLCYGTFLRHKTYLDDVEQVFWRTHYVKILVQPMKQHNLNSNSVRNSFPPLCNLVSRLIWKWKMKTRGHHCLFKWGHKDFVIYFVYSLILLPDRSLIKQPQGHEKATLPILFHCGTHWHLARLRKLENFLKILLTVKMDMWKTF